MRSTCPLRLLLAVVGTSVFPTVLLSQTLPQTPPPGEARMPLVLPFEDDTIAGTQIGGLTRDDVGVVYAAALRGLLSFDRVRRRRYWVRSGTQSVARDAQGRLWSPPMAN